MCCSCTCAAHAALQQSGTQLNSCTVARDVGVHCQEEKVAKLIGQENSFGSIILKCQPREFVLYIWHCVILKYLVIIYCTYVCMHSMQYVIIIITVMISWYALAQVFHRKFRRFGDYTATFISELLQCSVAILCIKRLIITIYI